MSRRFKTLLCSNYVLFEIKRPSRTAGLKQLKSYCNTEETSIGIWSNGNEIIRLHREEPNLFIEIPRIPKVSETLSKRRLSTAAKKTPA